MYLIAAFSNTKYDMALPIFEASSCRREISAALYWSILRVIERTSKDQCQDICLYLSRDPESPDFPTNPDSSFFPQDTCWLPTDVLLLVPILTGHC